MLHILKSNQTGPSLSSHISIIPLFQVKETKIKALFVKRCSPLNMFPGVRLQSQGQQQIWSLIRLS